tara:strand:+ start:662 stop:1000 length:339 start_codon:yes stop_codon:yes gene_type:complete
MELRKKYDDGGLTNRQFRQNERAQKKYARERKLIENFAEGDVDKLMTALEGGDEYMDFKERRKILKQLARMGGLAALTKIIPALKNHSRLATGGTQQDRFEYFTGQRRPPGG